VVFYLLQFGQFLYIWYTNFKPMKRSILITMLLIGLFEVKAQVNTIITAPPTNSANGTTSLRAPNGNVSHTSMRACYHVPANELSQLSATVTSFGFVFTSTLASAPAGGTLTVYLANTASSSYTLGTAWSTATVGMTQVYDGYYSLPTGSTPTVVDVPFPSSFTYNPGDALFVAYEYVGSNFTPNSAVYRAYTNSVVTAGATNNSNSLPALETLSTTTFRPLFRFGTPNTYTNEVVVQSLNAPGKVSETTGTSHQVSATIFNGSNSTLNNIPVSLVITGANAAVGGATISSLAAGTATEVLLATYNPTVYGASSLAVSVPADENNSNNSLSWTQSVTCNVIASNPASVSPISYSAGVGFNTNSGKILVHSQTSSSQTLTGVNIGISTNAASGGNAVFAVVADNTGNILANSNTVFIVPSMYNTFEYFTFTPPVVYSANTNYYVGLAQPASTPGYFPLGATAASVAVNTPTFYATQSFTGGAVTPLTTNLGYFAIEPVFMTTLCVTTSLNKVDNALPLNFIVYPNPANNKIKIESANVNQQSVVEILDLNGKVVWQQKGLNTKEELNIESVKSGVYMIRIRTGREQSVSKLIIN